MSIVSENDTRLVGKIYFNDDYLGSCIPCLLNNIPYIITCGHVIYGDDFTKKIKDSDKFKIISNGNEFYTNKIITKFEISKEKDIVLIKLDANDSNFDKTNLLNLKLCTDINKDIISYEHNLVLHPKIENTVSLISLKSFTHSLGENAYRAEVEKNTFHNVDKGTSGAKEYKGVSGSGLFISYKDNIYLAGILSNIPKATLTTQLILQRVENLFCSLTEDIYYKLLTTNIIKITPTNSESHSPRNVFFTNYTTKSKDYYRERECDKEFDINLSYEQNIWLHGKSGTGKTALVLRNLIENNYNYIYCDLEPVKIDSSDKIWQGIIDDISLFLDNDFQYSKLDVRTISQYLTESDLKENTIIAIDEMSCDDSEIINQFCDEVVRLVRYYTKKNPSKSIIFIISSIFTPISYNCNKGKIIESFQFICTDNWKNIDELFELQNDLLKIGICNEGKNIIIANCENLPRLLTVIMRNIHKSQNTEIDNIKHIVDIATTEHL